MLKSLISICNNNKLLRENKYLFLSIVLFLLLLLIGMEVRNVFSLQYFLSLLIATVGYICYIWTLKKIIKKLTQKRRSILQLSPIRIVLLTFVFIGLFVFTNVLVYATNMIIGSIITGKQLTGSSCNSIRIVVLYLMIIIAASYINAHFLSSNVDDKNTN